MTINTLVIITSILGALGALAGLINIIINISTHGITSTIRVNTNSRLSEALTKITTLLNQVISLKDTIVSLSNKVISLESLLMKVTGTTSVEAAHEVANEPEDK